MRIAMRRRIVKSGDVGEQDQQVGARHRCDPRGEAVIVAVADLAGCDRVVLVDDRNGAHGEETPKRRARVEIAAALFRVLQGQEHLAHDNAVLAKRARPFARKGNLSDRRRSLAVVELERAFGQPRDRAAKRDRAGRHDYDACAALVESGDVRRERFEPFASDGAKGPVDQER